MAYSKINQPKISDVIMEQLERMILEGSLQPGQKLPPERELAVQFEVSRPSLREAIQKLEAKGLLMRRQGGGTYVKEQLWQSLADPIVELMHNDSESQYDLLEFRHATEGMMAYFAALRGTDADMQNINISIPLNKEIVENRFGYDIRLDWLIGCWFEASWVNKQGDLGILKNQEVMNLGFDYTIGIGSGLYMAFEQLLMAYNERPFVFEDKTTVSFSLLSMSYPVGLFDNVSAIVYYDWKNNNAYNFVNYQKQIKNISLFAMAYWNPESYAIPTQGGSTNLFGGKGIQLMLVWNH